MIEPGRMKLLIVDDEPSVCMAIKRALRALPIEIFMAHSGDEGLAALTRDPSVFAIISDYTMPDMDGIAFLERTRAVSPDAFRILLTATGSCDQAIAWMESGLLHRYVAKPWDNDRLRSTIQLLMHQRHEKRAP